MAALASKSTQSSLKSLPQWMTHQPQVLGRHRVTRNKKFKKISKRNLPNVGIVWGPAPFALTGKGLVASAYSTRTNGIFRTRIPRSLVPIRMHRLRTSMVTPRSTCMRYAQQHGYSCNRSGFVSLHWLR